MEASTTIRRMMQGNRIIVPDYQRAYSWDTDPEDKDHRRQVNAFLIDLEDYLRSEVPTPYYFGHFLYENIGENRYAIIDGQQRLTTITIFLSVLFRYLENIRPLTDEELDLREGMLFRRKEYRFSTVQYDNQLYKDYVIDGCKTDRNGIVTTSGNRIADAYDFLYKKVSEMDEEYVIKLLNAVAKASCTTHIVDREAEAIQMFIFQNDRGKKPSNLEVIKALFMYTIHIYGGEEAKGLLEEVKSRFENIYRSISSIENFVKEDTVLTNTLRVYYNKLDESDSMGKITAELGSDERLQFIHDFCISLEHSFNNLVRLNKDRIHDVNIEGSLLCGNYDIVLPFYIKAYSQGFATSEISKMAKSLGDLTLRDAIVKTRADLSYRLKDIFKDFDSADQIVERVQQMKDTNDGWWGYWSNASLKTALEASWYDSSHKLAKILLWKYENYLITKEGKAGYSPISFSSIEKPNLEHIAPQTENGEKEAAGYDTYDDDFRNNYLCSLGNFLLLSGSHNDSIGNKPFEAKRNTYTQLRQQREIQDLTAADHAWTRDKIAKRKQVIIDFFLENL